jgi:hypothetical protein
MIEIQKADQNTRRKAIAIVGAGTLLGAVLITMADQFQPEVRAWVEQDPHVRVRVVIMALVLLTTGPALAMSAYFWHLGRRIVRAGRCPPPGLCVWRDTPVLTGRTAVVRGRLLATLGAVFGVAGLLLAFFLWRLMSLVGTGA